jgi:lipopolysaccharide/colanic/teichoic acid biosynthesis glycosyltransferase
VVSQVERERRVTPLGALLLHYSLDELPQLINVSRREKSLVSICFRTWRAVFGSAGAY